jgi:inosine-uridine nucleoside N-ribohydrolase
MTIDCDLDCLVLITSQGCDDVMAMLLALAASPEDLEVILISVTYGNIDVQNCLRNVVSLFHHIEKEIEWRKANGRPVGFEALTKTKPLVAVGPEHPLADEMLMADYFRESDCLPCRYVPELTVERWNRRSWRYF